MSSCASILLSNLTPRQPLSLCTTASHLNSQLVLHNTIITIDASLIRTTANLPFCAVGKTTKFNDRNHAGLADGSATPEDHLPRYFAKSGYEGTDPKKMKKAGAGKGGW
jgi:hypothetical protein